MATPTQTTTARTASNVGADPVVAAGLTFQAGRDVVVHIGAFTSGSSISGVSIGGTAGSLIARQKHPDNDTYAESWLIDGVGSDSSDVNVTLSGSGLYVTLVGREFAGGTFGSIDASAAGGASGSAQTMDVSTAASIANASSALFATFCCTTSANPVGFIGISGYSDVVEQEDNIDNQGVMVGWLEETTTGVKTASGSQASNFPWVGSIGVVALGGPRIPVFVHQLRQQGIA